jgi:hypothetical protein
MKTRKFKSELQTTAELHAGLNLFGFVYQEFLEFLDNGKIIYTKQVVDEYKYLDINDKIRINSFEFIGQYSINDSGYIICAFEDLFLDFTGDFTKNGLLIFSIYDKRLKRSWQQVYSPFLLT